MTLLESRSIRWPLVPVLLFGAAPLAHACASCGCTTAADWLNQGLNAQPGTTLSLRYDYIPQTALQTDTRQIDRNAISLPTDREIERYTYNHIATVTLDHQFANDWGVDVQAPFVLRPHSTFAEGTAQASHSRTQGLGDVRVTARWQGLSTPGSVTGLEAGLVLPTGGFHDRFDSGPARGEVVDRGLQPGTGTFQAVVGVYHLGAIGGDFGYFMQIVGQAPLGSRAGFRPGKSVQAAAAINYRRWRGVTPQIQVSVRAAGKDSGPEADRPNSGGEQVNLSPGVSVQVSPRLVAFGNVELPVYNRVAGYQLVPKAKASLGILLHL